MDNNWKKKSRNKPHSYCEQLKIVASKVKREQNKTERKSETPTYKFEYRCFTFHSAFALSTSFIDRFDDDQMSFHFMNSLQYPFIYHSLTSHSNNRRMNFTAHPKCRQAETINIANLTKRKRIETELSSPAHLHISFPLLCFVVSSCVCFVSRLIVFFVLWPVNGYSKRGSETTVCTTLRLLHVDSRRERTVGWYRDRKQWSHNKIFCTFIRTKRTQEDNTILFLLIRSNTETERFMAFPVRQ